MKAAAFIAMTVACIAATNQGTIYGAAFNQVNDWWEYNGITLRQYWRNVLVCQISFISFGVVGY